MINQSISNGVTTFIYSDDVEMVVVCGDIHGAFTPIVNKITAQYNIENALVIIAGDCGFGFERPGYYDDIYKRCSKKLKEHNVHIAFVRGNHDNPEYFKNSRVKKDYWMTIPDYSVIKAAGKTILCVGGATSVDRMLRLHTKPLSNALHYKGPVELKPDNYWSSEPTFYSKELLDEVTKQHKCDTVVTHTAPSWCEMCGTEGIMSFVKNDMSLLDNLKTERKAMDDIYEHLKRDGHLIENWLYGHFHHSWHARIDDTMFHMLDCEELRQLY